MTEQDTELMLDVGQANELKLAMRRNGWRNADIKELCRGNTLSGVLSIVRGKAKIKPCLDQAVDIKVWKTIKLGTHSAKDLKKIILKQGFQISSWADDLMGQKAFTVAKTETEVDIAVLSVEELGRLTNQDFSQGARYDAICGAIKQLGELCPSEVGPQLRMQYAAQPYGEWIVVAMEPISGSVGYPIVFRVH